MELEVVAAVVWQYALYSSLLEELNSVFSK